MEDKQTSFKRLLDKFKGLKPREVVEANVFSIGGRGYYENPTTEILEFFCDDKAQHQLENTVLAALFDCLSDTTRELDCSLTTRPEREVVTKNFKRIDLLLEGPDWVMVLENKIYHQQNNPFADYQSYVDDEKQRFGNKTRLFVVLAPAKEQLPADWHFVSYPDLIAALKNQLTKKFISQPINKWTLFLREFILHLESLMPQPSVNQQAIKFVLDNLSEIREIQQLKDEAINEYHQHLKTLVEAQLGQSVSIRLHSWGGYPALRFALTAWQKTYSDLVLFLSSDTFKTKFNVYASLRHGVNAQQADAIVMKDLKPKTEFELGKKIRTYSHEEHLMAEQQIVQFISARLLELDELENLYVGASS